MIIHKIEKGELEMDPGQKIIRSNLYQNYLSAQETLDKVCEERREAQEHNKNTSQKAQAQGYQAGKDVAHQELLQQKVEFVRKAQHWAQMMEREMFRGLSALLEKIIGTMDKDELLRAVIRQNIQTYAQLPDLKLLVAVGQKAVAEETLLALSFKDKIEIEEDGRLKKGDSILESPLGSLDASLNVQLASLKTLLAKIPLQPFNIEEQRK